MDSQKNIYDGKSIIAKIIRNKTAIKNGLRFFSDPSEPFQVAIHEYTSRKETNLHHNSLKKAITLTEKQKIIYMVKGKALVKFYKVPEKILKNVTLNEGDGIIIGQIHHKVVFYPGSKALELKQGPYENE